MKTPTSMHIKYHIALMYAVEMNFTFKVGSREMMGCRNRNIGLTCPPPRKTDLAHEARGFMTFSQIKISIRTRS